MSEPVISAYRSLPQALHEWSLWVTDTAAAYCAGFPKRSVLAMIEDLHLQEHGEIQPRPGICPYCRPKDHNKARRPVADLEAHIRKQHPERYRETASGRQTRTPAYYSADDHPVAEAVEGAIVFIGRTRPELFHVIVADVLGLVPRYRTGWDKKRWTNLDHYKRVHWRVGDKEADYKQRLAQEMGIGLSTFYRLREQAMTAIGTCLDLRRERHVIDPA